MDWSDLRFFLEVARHHKLADAALRLHIDPTTLSRRIRRLESDLNTMLFQRTPKGHTLTTDGIKVASYAQDMERASMRAKRDLMAKSRRAMGVVRLGATEGFGTWIVAPALGALHKQNPNLEVDLITSRGSLSITKHEVDIAILLERPISGRIKIRKLSDYRFKVYGSKDYLDQHKPVSAVQDLNQHKFVGYVEDLVCSPQLQYYKEVLPHVRSFMRSTSIIAQYKAVIGGAGLGVLPCFIAASDPDLVPVLPEEVFIDRTFWLAIHEDMAGLVKIQAVSEFLTEIVKSKKSHLMGKEANNEYAVENQVYRHGKIAGTDCAIPTRTH